MRYALFGTLTLLAAAVLAGAVHAENDHRGERSHESRRVLRIFEVLSEGLQTPEQAIAAATAVCPGSAVEVELGTERIAGRRVVVWEVSIVAGAALREVVLNARDGSVIEQSEETEDVDEAREYAAVLSKPGLSLADALKRLRSSAAGVVLAAELDDEGAAGAWEFELVAAGAAGEIELSRETGLVLDDDDEDDDDDAADHEDDDDEDDD